MDFDSIDEKTAFKLGFAQRCFELGLDPGQVKEAMEKGALKIPRGGIPRGRAPRITLGKGLGWGLGLGGAGTAIGGVAQGLLPHMPNILKDWGGALIGLGGLGGLVGGAALGYGKAKLDEEDIDEEAIKAKELADTYNEYADRLRAQKAYQDYKKSKMSVL